MGHLVSRAATSRAVERQDVDRGKPDSNELPDRLFSLLESRSSLTEWPSTGRAKRGSEMDRLEERMTCLSWEETKD